MREPQNSWEVSYVFSMKRPNIKLGIPRRDIFLKVGLERGKELMKWTETEDFDSRWIRDHI